MQSQKGVHVFAHFTSKQILPFGFSEQYRQGYFDPQLASVWNIIHNSVSLSIYLLKIYNNVTSTCLDVWGSEWAINPLGTNQKYNKVHFVFLALKNVPVPFKVEYILAKFEKNGFHFDKYE